jgi:hypothetical protein
MRNNINLKNDMKKITNMSIHQRMCDIQDNVKECLQVPGFAQDLADMKVTLDNNLLQLQGRVLPAPSIHFGNTQA